jgi:preprotein translocase subunit SecE
MQKVVAFFKDVRTEMSRVTWPTRPELLESTGIVIVTTIAISMFVGLVNLVFQKGLGWILTGGR